MDRSLSRDLARAVDEREADAASPRRAPGTIKPTDKGAVTRAIRARVRGVSWRLVVPGMHPGSSLTYDELLDVLESQGRDFRARTSAMDRYVLAEVQARFEATTHIPLMREIDEVVGLAVLSWIVKRFEAKVRDERLRRLTLDYARRKKRDGYGDRPIGVRTGALALRVAEFGRAIVRKAA